MLVKLIFMGASVWAVVLAGSLGLYELKNKNKIGAGLVAFLIVVFFMLNVLYYMTD